MKDLMDLFVLVFKFIDNVFKQIVDQFIEFKTFGILYLDVKPENIMFERDAL